MKSIIVPVAFFLAYVSFAHAEEVGHVQYRHFAVKDDGRIGFEIFEGSKKPKKTATSLDDLRATFEDLVFHLEEDLQLPLLQVRASVAQQETPSLSNFESFIEDARGIRDALEELSRLAPLRDSAPQVQRDVLGEVKTFSDQMLTQFAVIGITFHNDVTDAIADSPGRDKVTEYAQKIVEATRRNPASLPTGSDPGK